MINWQLSKQGIRWPVSPDRTAGSSVDPSRSSIFWSYPLTNYKFEMIAGSSLFFPSIHIKYVVLMSLWPSTGADWTYLGPENSASYLKIQAGKTFSYHGHALVTLYVQFLCSDWSNLTGEFMRKIYAASWNLFTIFDSWSWHSFVSTCTVMFFNVFFHWMNKMKYSCYQESSVVHGWFVYWVFGWEMRRLSKSEIRFWMASFSFFTLLDT